MNDPDDGQNGEVTFEVNSAKFFVNRTSGILYNSQPLDREIQSQYQLTIQATDKGTLPKVRGEKESHSLTTNHFLSDIHYLFCPPEISDLFCHSRADKPLFHFRREKARFSRQTDCYFYRERVRFAVKE